jgi:hypothetical protein
VFGFQSAGALPAVTPIFISRVSRGDFGLAISPSPALTQVAGADQLAFAAKLGTLPYGLSPNAAGRIRTC